MTRLNVLAEGYTERDFAEKLLAPYVDPQGRQVFARCVTTGRDHRKGRVYRGGLPNYGKVKADLTRWLKECPGRDVYFSTMFDYYALPTDFPGYDEAIRKADAYERVLFMEDAFAKDVGDPRLIPYIQLHEFEALLFVAPRELSWTYIESENAIENLEAVSQSFGNRPEKIDNGPDTAPSKRILKEIPEYDKVAAGVDTLELVGIDALKEACPHFSEWVEKLVRIFV